ncbi:MAG TPA: hypothetical protein VN782_10850 [Usitatibacter sp.]|nr:hypothetical protein [Usitatibacter sp.]
MNTYGIALDIAAGVRPVARRAGARFSCAASFVERALNDRLVMRVPSA